MLSTEKTAWDDWNLIQGEATRYRAAGPWAMALRSSPAMLTLKLQLEKATNVCAEIKADLEEFSGRFQSSDVNAGAASRASLHHGTGPAAAGSAPTASSTNATVRRLRQRLAPLFPPQVSRIECLSCSSHTVRYFFKLRVVYVAGADSEVL